MKLPRILTVALLVLTLLCSSAVGQRHRHRRTTYTNTAGHRVHSPVKGKHLPSGATARCRDGLYSFSQNHRGTCSHHGGVAQWLD
jgi:hypothetical protein